MFRTARVECAATKPKMHICRCYVPTGFQANWFHNSSSRGLPLSADSSHIHKHITGDFQVASHVYCDEYDCISEHSATATYENIHFSKYIFFARLRQDGFDLARTKVTFLNQLPSTKPAL